MGNRGRPKTRDVLTPREYEVLALLREGLSNRQIAERLGISLAGAKFHVSEIIGKLGVASREEAAGWQEPQRRWGVSPFGMFTALGESMGAMLTPKAAAFALALLVAGGLVGGVILAEKGRPSDHGIASLGGAEPTPAPWTDPCATLPAPMRDAGCVSFLPGELQFSTLEEAAAETSFRPKLPAYVPEGYERKSLDYRWPLEAHSTGPASGYQAFEPKGPGAPFESLTAEYVNEIGEVLRVIQGYALGIPNIYDDVPADYRGSLETGGRQVFWYVGEAIYEYTTDANGNRFGKPVAGAWEDSDRVAVFWQAHGPSKGAAWEIAPDGTKRVFEARGRPFEYVVYSDSLPLEEMLRIAQSVP
jgi:DNA-binding CsgD family transcriptional regulator